MKISRCCIVVSREVGLRNMVAITVLGSQIRIASISVVLLLLRMITQEESP